MKKIILICFAVILSFDSQAQLEKGTFQVGIGGLPIIYPDNSLQMGYSLRGNVGYFPISKLVVGIMPFAGRVDYIKSIGAGLYARYYLSDKNFSFFVEGGTGFGSVKYDNGSQSDGTMNSINIGPGAHYVFKNKLAIEVMVQYAKLKNISHPEATMTGNTFIPTLGIQYFISK